MASQNCPPELRDLINAHIKGFNEQDKDLFMSVFGDTAIIIDGIAPYRWLNPKAPANWLADCEKWRANLGVTHEHLGYEMGFWNVEGSAAYGVISGTCSMPRTARRRRRFRRNSAGPRGGNCSMCTRRRI